MQVTAPDSTISSPPRVSVITAVYNGESTLGSTLQGLLQQDFTDFESLVVNDGSSDGSEDIVWSFAEVDPRIRLISQTNGGVSNAWNRGIREARGEYVAFLDQDDLWHPQKLSGQAAFLDSHREFALVGCDSALLDDRAHQTGWKFGGTYHGTVYREMLQCDLIGGGSVAMVRRSAFGVAGRFDESDDLKGRSDWDQWIRLTRHFPAGSVRRTLVGYRRHDGCYSRDYRRMLSAGESVLEKAARQDPGLDENFLRVARARDAFGIACLCLSDLELRHTWECIRRSVATSPRPILTSVRRWGVLLLLCVATVFPTKFYSRALDAVGRLFFGTRVNKPFGGSSPR